MTDERLVLLRDEWRRLQQRYGVLDPDEVARLRLASTRRRNRVRQLSERLSALEVERDVLETELAGIERVLEAVLEDAIRSTRARQNETWSPTPVYGYRIWDLRSNGFFGFRERWRASTMTAHCPNTETTDEIPHTDGRCGDPPCGIYAAKSLDTLLDSHGGRQLPHLAVGLVGLEGKVVEHQRGYRGESASVKAIAFARDHVLFTTNDDEEIQMLFEGVSLQSPWNSTEALALGTSIDRDLMIDHVSRFLDSEKERNCKWI